MEHTHKAHTIGDIATRTAFITSGALLMAYGLEAVLIPNNIIDGGVVGVSMMISKMTGLSLGLLIFILNIPFLILGYKQIGKTFALSALWGIIVLSISTKAMHHISPFIVNDPFLATVFGGLLIGTGIGLVIRHGGVLDGTETLAILINKKTPFTVGMIILLINILIFSIAIFVYEPKTALYSMITYFVAFNTINMVEKGLSENRSVHIISEKHLEIAESIEDRLGRGVTYLKGTGGHTGNNQEIIWCVITRLEENKIIDIVNDFDKNAFLTLADVTEVKGGRFKKKDIH